MSSNNVGYKIGPEYGPKSKGDIASFLIDQVYFYWPKTSEGKEKKYMLGG